MEFAVRKLDFNALINGTSEQKIAFSQELGKAYQETGFVIIKNHGLDKELREKLYSQLKMFFALPDQEKQRYEFPEFCGQRGYTGKGREKAKDAKKADLKEFFQVGQYDDEKGLYPENIEIKELPELNMVCEEVFRKLSYTGKHILRAVAVFLGIDEFYFDDKIYNGDSILRLIHYFPLSGSSFSPEAVRAAAHEDINLITLLMGASAEGLELLTRDGRWMPVNAGEDELVINAGDMLQRLTNNRLRSTTHRVVNPPEGLWHLPRYSTPFFLHPQPGMDLTCLPECVTAENPAGYEPITAGEYLAERLEKIGLKKVPAGVN